MKKLGDRIKYVRENLEGEDGAMTQPEFAKAVGLAEGHHTVGRWENDVHEPAPRHRQEIAELTPYEPDDFSRAGAAEVVEETSLVLLRAIRAAVEESAEKTAQSLAALARGIARIEAQRGGEGGRARKGRDG